MKPKLRGEQRREGILSLPWKLPPKAHSITVWLPALAEAWLGQGWVAVKDTFMDTSWSPGTSTHYYPQQKPREGGSQESVSPPQLHWELQKQMATLSKTLAAEIWKHLEPPPPCGDHGQEANVRIVRRRSETVKRAGAWTTAVLAGTVCDHVFESSESHFKDRRLPEQEGEAQAFTD